MYLKDDKITVKIDGTIFVSHKASAPRFILDPTAIQGWHDGVDVRGNSTNRPISWGDFEETALLTSRLISLSGTAIARDFSELHRMRDEFTGILVSGDFKEMSLTDGDSTRYSTVQLGSKPSWTQLSDTVAVWKLELFAPDPRIYGPAKAVSIQNQSAFGGIDFGAGLGYQIDYGIQNSKQYTFLDNLGNTESWPIFVVYGDFSSGFVIKDNLGKEIEYKGVVSLTTPVIINPMLGSATQNGVDRSVYLTKRQWFSIGPDEILQPSFIPRSDTYGWCDIILRDTWI